VAQELADDLDAGALPSFAWERAVELGHDPQAWIDDFLAQRANQQAATASRDAPTA
jgi:hypothetical protein